MGGLGGSFLRCYVPLRHKGHPHAGVSCSTLVLSPPFSPSEQRCWSWPPARRRLHPTATSLSATHTHQEREHAATSTTGRRACGRCTPTRRSSLPARGT